MTSKQAVRRKFRIPRSTVFAFFGAAILIRQGFFVERADYVLVVTGLLLIQAIPVEILERALRGSILSETPPPADDKGSAP